ncbi:MAG: SpoIID/LytB domain-containing protein [Mobilitalea sp.]
MSIKRKLILIGVCVAIIIVVFTVNVMQKIQEDKKGTQESIVDENIVTRAEAFRLLSYLEYNKAEREAIPLGITYANAEMSDWYDTYVNAIWKMGLIQGNVTIAPSAALTYGDCKQLIDNLIIKNPGFQAVYSNISFDFLKAQEDMLIPEFLELYQALLNTITSDAPFEEKTLFVLGSEAAEDGPSRMVTDDGTYYYVNAKSYEEYFKEESVADVTVTPGASNQTNDTLEQDKDDLQKDSKTDESTDENVTNVNSQEQANAEDANGNISEEEVQTDNEGGNSQLSLIDRYLDQGVQALVCDKEIIYIMRPSDSETVLRNVWIAEGKDSKVQTFINGIDRSFTTVYKLSTELSKVVGDITIANKKVVSISVKPDIIQGKVLRTGENFIEVEGYGEIELEEDYKIYKIYGTLSMEPTGSILVGYENTDFIVSAGKISAALITESIKAENIRVLLETTGYKGMYHSSVKFTANEAFTIRTKESQKSYKAGDTVTIKPTNKLFSEGRITIETTTEKGKIELLSVERSYGNPKYRGSIEISSDENGLILVNELPLEEYLYAVIPSEMPTSYGEEALKVQALCARTYAYKHLLSNSLSQYGAHVNDSVDYQVYNNIAENETSILAVKDTYGKVIEYDGEVITALYFSTSSGHTADSSTAWNSNSNLPYLKGKLLASSKEGESSEVLQDTKKLYEDLSSEERFETFIKSKDISTYDSSFGWYRWKVTMSAKDIKKVVDKNLPLRYAANPGAILTMTSKAKNGNEAVFESIPVDTVGDIVDISVEKRDSSGMILELLITGSEHTIKVKTEYNIRALLAPLYDTIIRADESEVNNLSVLPSAFFTIDKKSDNGLSTVTLSGGGYGHGVGLSQNGVKGMVDAGKKYEEIVSYFYEGTELGYIYE